MNLNQLNLIGRVGGDPEIKALPSGTSVAKFSLATNYSYKGKDGNKVEETEWHNIVAFGKVADIIAQYVVKGQILFVSGRLKTDTWEAQDGTKRYKTNVILEKFNFGPKPGGNDGQAPRQTQSRNEAPETVEYDEGEVNPDEIPF